MLCEESKDFTDFSASPFSHNYRDIKSLCVVKSYKMKSVSWTVSKCQLIIFSCFDQKSARLKAKVSVGHILLQES